MLRIFFSTVVLWASACTLVWAGPPYETDDPVPTTFRNYEIYFHTDYHRVGQNINGSIGTLEFNYGLLPNTQVSFAIPYAFTPVSEGAQYGPGDVEVGLKYRFLSETQARPQIAFYPSVTLATGDPDIGLGEGHGTLFLPLWAQKSYGRWTIFGGGGLQFDRHGSQPASWQEGIAITRDVSDATNFGVEIYHATPAGALLPGYTDIGVGMIGEIGNYHALLFSFGRALEPDGIHGYAAYEWRLGP